MPNAIHRIKPESPAGVDRVNRIAGGDVYGLSRFHLIHPAEQSCIGLVVVLDEREDVFASKIVTLPPPPIPAVPYVAAVN